MYIILLVKMLSNDIMIVIRWTDALAFQITKVNKTTFLHVKIPVLDVGTCTLYCGFIWTINEYLSIFIIITHLLYIPQKQ